jgi:hypothetical protein
MTRIVDYSGIRESIRRAALESPLELEVSFKTREHILEGGETVTKVLLLMRNGKDIFLNEATYENEADFNRQFLSDLYGYIQEMMGFIPVEPQGCKNPSEYCFKYNFRIG